MSGGCATAATRGEGAASASPPTVARDAAAAAEPIGEHITRLFPKCRPRRERDRDVNLNPLAHTRTADPNAATATATARNHRRSHRVDNDRDAAVDRLALVDGTGAGGSSDEDQTDCNMTTDIPHHINNSKHGPYKFRDSRIIEIAGGREVYSQSRTKAVRKMRQSNNIHKVSQQQRHKHKAINDISTIHDVYSVENTSPQNAMSPIQDYSRRQLTTMEQMCPLPRESPPPLDSPLPVAHKGSPIAVVAGGEVVVFDDISDNWKGLRLDLDGSEEEPGRIGSPVNGVKKEPWASSGSSPSGGGGHSDVSDASAWSGTPGKVTRVIGGLPIAEYEGSPRRYGIGPPQARSPRPGFPQRISANDSSPTQTVEQSTVATTFDYLYEFSETRKVLEEFFRCPTTIKSNVATDMNDDLADFQDLDYELRRQQHDAVTPDGDDGLDVANEDNVDGLADDAQDADSETGGGSWYVGRRLASESPRPMHNHTNFLGLQEHDTYEPEVNLVELSVGTGSSGSGSHGRRGTGAGLGAGGAGGLAPAPGASGPAARFAMSPETTDCDSNCGDLDSEVSLMMDNELHPSLCEGIRPPNSMPVLEDGLSSGHASDNDNNNSTTIARVQIHKPPIGHPIVENGLSATHDVTILSDADLNSLDPLASCEATPPPPAPAPHRGSTPGGARPGRSLSPPRGPAQASPASRGSGPAPRAAGAEPEPALREADLRPEPEPHDPAVEQIWVPRRRAVSGESIESAERKPTSGDEDEADTDLETDRLLGQQRTDDQGFYDDKRKKRKTVSSAKAHQQQGWRKPRSRTVGGSSRAGQAAQPSLVPSSPAAADPASPIVDDDKTCTTNGKKPADKEGKKKGKNKEVVHSGRRYSTLSTVETDKKTGIFHAPEVLIEGVLFRARYLGSTQLACEGQPTKATRMLQAEEAVSRIKECQAVSPYDGVYQHCHEIAGGIVPALPSPPRPVASPPAVPTAPTPGPPPGTVFHLAFLGSVEVDEEAGGRRRRKRLKKTMVEEAVAKIKAPEGETQPSTEVDLFISTEKIMVLNTELKEIMMDHALRTISYIADIGDLVVLMARRRFVPHDTDSDPPKLNRTPKMICHVFESEEAQFIAQSIGQAFQVAYMEFLKANGIEDHSFVKEMDYQEVLNSQEIFGDELQMFAKKELQKEVVVPKTKGEILGVVVVESGWGSMLPTVVIANLAPSGAAARCGQLNIGDQIIAINGVSLVGLPLSTCQTYIKNSKNQTVVKLTVVPCPPVVEVKIKRPDTKYQLGFSVQNGVICSLLRGGIAERGGVRVGHRIIEINSQSVVAVPHERIVNLLATSVGEILMKTMPTSMFRLLTGQENPVYI